MDYVEKARALRADPAVHYNCCQAVLVTFADRLGLTPEQANALGAHFGSGMRHGSTCGAVSGALMVLGLLGCDEKQSTALLRDFRTRHGALDCADLLRASKERGELRKDHCDSLVLEMSRFLEELLREQSPPPTPLFHPPASPAAPRSAGALRSPPSRRSFSPVPPM